MHIKLLTIMLLTLLNYIWCYDLMLGDKSNRDIIHHVRVKTYALPFVKRVKTVSYKDQHKRKIKALAVIDKGFSGATANVTAGGIGYDYISIRLKSERSKTLNYEVEMYA